MGTESPKRNAFALGFSLPLASFFRVTETKTLFGLRFGPPLATASTAILHHHCPWYHPMMFDHCCTDTKRRSRLCAAILVISMSLACYVLISVSYWKAITPLALQSPPMPTIASAESNSDTRSNNRISAAIVYLGNEKHFVKQRKGRPSCSSVYDSLKSLATYYRPVDYRSDSTIFSGVDLSVIMMYDGKLSNSTRLALTEASPFPLYFREILYIQPRDDKWANVSIVGYKRMCAFWFHYLFELEFLPDYIMRLDTDSCLVSNVDINPFQYMVENQIEYMYHSIIGGRLDLVEGLKEFIIENPGQSFNNNSALTLFKKGHIELFTNNVEWLYLPAFRRPPILEWKEKVRQNGGIFRIRWGDAPLRTIVTTMFFNNSRISRFCSFSYNHSRWTTLKACTKKKDDLVDRFGWNIVYLNKKTKKSVLP